MQVVVLVEVLVVLVMITVVVLIVVHAVVIVVARVVVVLQLLRHRSRSRQRCQQRGVHPASALSAPGEEVAAFVGSPGWNRSVGVVLSA